MTTWLTESWVFCILCNHLCRGLVSEQKKSYGCFCDPALEFHDIRNKRLNFGFSTRFRFTLTSRLRFIPQPSTLKDVSEMKKQPGIKMYSLCLCCEVYGCTFPSRHSSVDWGWTQLDGHMVQNKTSTQAFLSQMIICVSHPWSCPTKATWTKYTFYTLTLPAVNEVKNSFYFLRSENWFTSCHPPPKQTTHHLLTLNESHTEGSFTTAMGSQDHRACGLLVVVVVSP